MNCKFGIKRSVPLSVLSKVVYKRKASLVGFRRALFMFPLGLKLQSAENPHRTGGTGRKKIK